MTNNYKEKLLQSERRYRVVTEQTGQLVYDYDISSGKIEWFGKIKEILGYSQKEINDFGIKGWEKHIHEEDRKDALQKLDEAFRKLRPYRVKYRFQKKNREYIYVEDNGIFLKDASKKGVEMLGTMKNITKEYELQRQMEEDEERYRTYIEQSNDGVVFLQDGKIQFINHKMEKMLGWSAKDVLGKSFTSFVDSSQLQMLQRNYVNRMSGKKVKSIYETILKSKGGILLSVELNAGIIKYKGKKADLVYVRDISERKKNEEKIIREKKKTELYLHTVPSIILTLDKKGNIALINEKGNEILGYKQNELIGRNWFDTCIPKRERKRVREVFRKMISGKIKFPEHFINNIITKTGVDRTISWHNSRIVDEKKQIIEILSSGDDITEKIQAEKSEKEKELILKTVLEGTPIATFYINNEHKIVYWNKTLEKLSGLKYIDMVGTKNHWKAFYERSQPCLADVLIENDKKKLKELYSGIYKKSEIIPNAYEVVDYFPKVGESGSWLSLNAVQIKDVHGKIVGSLETLEDITERKLAEQLLIEKIEDVRIEKEKVEKIIYGIGDGVFVLDKEYNIILFNKVAESISGYTAEEALGKPFYEILKFISEKDGTDKSAFLRTTLETGETHKMENHTLLLTKSGSKVPVSDSCAPLKDKNGSVIGGVVVFRDVTEERRIDQMKNEFISLASHQLRTPLSGIKWFLELLLKGKAGELNIQQKDYLTQVSESNERMISLIEDLLSVSHIETGKKFLIEKEKIVPSELLKESFEDLLPLAEQYGIKLVTKSTKACHCTAFADRSKIVQVYNNLISNAIKYSKKGGVVTISCKSEKNHVVIAIEDTGYGIPKKQQARVFEKFFRGDNIITKQTEGTGLGLYIAKAIVEANGGTMWFESEENKGSTFYFTLPKK